MSQAVVILGHGSRAPGASAAMQRVVAGLRARVTASRVELAHMSQCSPTLEQVIATCAAEGAREILVVPYFLHQGVHLKSDIPRLLHELQVQHAGVTIRLGPHLGFDEAIVDLLVRRVAEARSAPGIAAAEPASEQPLGLGASPCAGTRIEG